MAAPDGIVWGRIENSKIRLGIYTGLSSTNDTTTISVEVWVYSKWSVNDHVNTFYFDNDATYATTSKGSVTIKHTIDTGWDTRNQTKLATYTFAYNRATTARTINCAARLADIEVANGNDVTVSTSYTIPALPSYTISYNANGGSGAPTSQTKYYGVNLTLSTTVPTRTGYSFQGWSASSTATSASYSAGSTYTGNTNATLYAVWKANTYTVSYNANGGSGAPSNQTKTYGVNLTLSSTIPTRTNYNFLGWGTSANSTTASYSAGGTYTNNAAITLYAVWELSYTKPRITVNFVGRTNSSGHESDTGTYFATVFNWYTDVSVSSVIVYWKTVSSTSWSSKNYSVSGTSGTVSDIVSGNISLDYSYDVQIYVADANGHTYINFIVPGLRYSIDVLNGGKGVSMFKPAEREGLDVNGKVYISDTIYTSGKGIEFPYEPNPPVGDNDSVSFWLNKNFNITYFNKDRAGGTLGNTPTGYGYVVTFSDSNDYELSQLWFSLRAGDMAHRSGTIESGFSSDWKTLVDSNNFFNYGVPKTGGTFTGHVTLNNSVNNIGYFRLHNDWIGIYSSSSDSQNHTNRKCWFGVDGTTNFYITNEAGGSNISNKTWTISSDRRLKKDIEDIPEIFAEIWKELQPKVFKWNEKNGNDSKYHFGLIAQDVNSAFEKYGLDCKDYGFVNSFTISDDDTEYFGIAYDEYHMLTSLMVKEQQKQIDNLQAQINELKQLVQELTNSKE